jgi:hypothetical protein
LRRQSVHSGVVSAGREDAFLHAALRRQMHPRKEEGAPQSPPGGSPGTGGSSPAAGWWSHCGGGLK